MVSYKKNLLDPSHPRRKRKLSMVIFRICSFGLLLAMCLPCNVFTTYCLLYPVKDQTVELELTKSATNNSDSSGKNSHSLGVIKIPTQNISDRSSPGKIGQKRSQTKQNLSSVSHRSDDNNGDLQKQTISEPTGLETGIPTDRLFILLCLCQELPLRLRPFQLLGREENRFACLGKPDSQKTMLQI